MWRNTTKDPVRRRALLWRLAFAVLIAALILGAYFFGRSQSLAGLDPEDQDSVELYAEALNLVENDYVDQKAVDPDKQTYGAIKGMLDTLGDEGHTRFLTPEEAEDNSQNLSGKYVGIGVTLENKEGRAVVAAPIDGSPAAEAGIEPEDVLLSVNGEIVEGQEISKIAEQVRGPEGTEVELTVLRGEEEKSFTLKRAEVNLPVVSWAMVPGTDTADLRLTSFSSDSAGELRKAIDEARQAGAERFVLDLRNNPGGALDQAVEMAGFFLKPGSPVYLRQDASGDRKEVPVPNDAEPVDLPLTVLVNEGSASSSEILAGALRDNDRAELVGTQTFGTGTVLARKKLDDGSEILLGIAEWLTPDGDFIRESGIEPGVVVEMPEGESSLVPRTLEDLSQQEVRDRDSQLARALEVVRGE